MEPHRCPLCAETQRHRVRHRFPGRRTVVCVECDLEHVDPKPTQAELSNLYDSSDYFKSGEPRRGYRDYEGERRSIRSTSMARLKRLEEVGIGGRLLEIGPGLGYFLDVAEERGLEVTGLEVSGFALERLRKRHRVLSGNLWDHDFEDAYDVVVLFDTLEHIVDVRRLKEGILRALRPGGILAFTTPDNRSLASRLLGRNWWSYRFPEHVAFFNPRSARRWLGEEFEVLGSHVDWQYMELGRAADRVRNLSAGLGRSLDFLLRAFVVERRTVPLPNSNRYYIARRA